jgi:hypothetical protein
MRRWAELCLAPPCRQPRYSGLCIQTPLYQGSVNLLARSIQWGLNGLVSTPHCIKVENSRPKSSRTALDKLCLPPYGQAAPIQWGIVGSECQPHYIKVDKLHLLPYGQAAPIQWGSVGLNANPTISRSAARRYPDSIHPAHYI